MKKVVASTGMASGLLLVVVPRWVLPACEFEGYARMHCSDTARAVMMLGALVAAVGVTALGAKRTSVALAHAFVEAALLASAWLAPSVVGYCASPRMPCTYGMVPAVRFVSALAIVVLVTAVAALVMRRRSAA